MPRGGILTCAGCGTTDNVSLQPSRTAYAQPTLTTWDRILLDGEDPPDPNADIPLCEDCAVEHHSQWDEMWAEYHNGLL